MNTSSRLRATPLLAARLTTARLLATTAALTLALAACSDTDEEDTSSGDDDATPTETDETPDDTGDETPEDTQKATPSPPPTPVPGPLEPDEVDDIVTGLDAPWSIAFPPDGGDPLVSQRDEGTIVQVSEDGDVTEIGDVPGVEGTEEGGLLGIAFDPDAPENLYAYATMGAENRVVRTTFDGEEFGEFETVVDGISAHPFHNGGRLAFGPDGMLYVSTGDAGEGPRAQDPDTPEGAILRVTPEGDVPEDNPFDDSPVYSYGHRNVQGLAFDEEGRLWASEFGPDTVDELNLIEPGENYGWPEVDGIAGDERFVDPVYEWPVEEASPSGLAYFGETLFMASLRGERLWQIPVSDEDVAEPAQYIDDRGRLRDAVIAPDGTLWVLTNNTDGRGDPRDGDDRILRVTLEQSAPE
ncbi:PQQ-dependent sugar dehydrogenase [Actinobacteria bacterium YIM 96077]|uniref:PQQ-dependent sugar dehydrogenase n=1 Tax=Phytoactinopolyspora halophila TaxID=1981511 RepID=A0A329QA17_9ACTN|nr:PQQ-dependent sugar dehydrogenase [Phytoactinopolyspora halophila]AYY12458.1 PQQ-dependent sugar dehydrogenase [Actinobacteria bacterium YIM 96077]RAW09260.1 PQQ-dependent sugar dehydrogenase [Phytoactinopolyspora halophila]